MDKLELYMTLVFCVFIISLFLIGVLVPRGIMQDVTCGVSLFMFVCVSSWLIKKTKVKLNLCDYLHFGWLTLLFFYLLSAKYFLVSRIGSTISGFVGIIILVIGTSTFFFEDKLKKLAKKGRQKLNAIV